MLRRLLQSTATQNGDTIATDVPSSPSRVAHTSTTSLFIIYMAIGFSVTFACILIIMTAYHWIRRSLSLGATSRRPSWRSSSRTGHPEHEPKQLFVVKHPGGYANLAFRENEDLRPYQKKSSISVTTANLGDDSFTIAACRHDSTTLTLASEAAGTTALKCGGSSQAERHSQHSIVGLASSELQNSDRTAPTVAILQQRSVAHAASQTSPRHSAESTGAETAHTDSCKAEMADTRGQGLVVGTAQHHELDEAAQPCILSAQTLQ